MCRWALLAEQQVPIMEQLHFATSRRGRVLMFKVLVLQRLYNLADERLEDQIGDRLLGPKAFNQESQLRVGKTATAGDL